MLKITNITFNQEDSLSPCLNGSQMSQGFPLTNQSQLDLLMNLRPNPSHPITKPIKLNPNIKEKDREYFQTEFYRNQQIIPFPIKKLQKCSHQTKISEMFFVKSINLASKPTPNKTNSNENYLDNRQKQNSEPDKSRDNKNMRSSQGKLIHGYRNSCSLGKTKSFLQLPAKSKPGLDKKNSILQPLNNRNYSSIISSSSLKQLKKLAVLTELNTKDNSLLQKQVASASPNGVLTTKVYSQNCGHKVSDGINLKLQQLTNAKDCILEAKLTKYWQEIEQTAVLHNIELSPIEYQKTPIKYFLGKGNNSRLIKQVMKKRWWWAQSEDKASSQVCLVWLQLKDKSFYNIMECKQKRELYSTQNGQINLLNSNVRRLEINQRNRKKASKSSDSSSSTDGTLNSLNEPMSMSYPVEPVNQSQQNKSQSFIRQQSHKQSKLQAYTSSSERYQKKQIQLPTNTTIEDKADNAQLHQNENTSPFNANITQNTFSSIKRHLKNTPVRLELAMHNHYEHNQFLGNKKALYYNMRQYYQSLQKNVFDFLPLTFHVHSTTNDLQFTQFKKYYQQQLIKDNRKRLWILKPGENSNRGRGITIHSEIQEIIALIENSVDKGSQSLQIQPTAQQNKFTEKTNDHMVKNIESQPTKDQNEQNNQNQSCPVSASQFNSRNNNKLRTFIIQQYIERPFLYNKRKFDIRCFVLLVSLNGIIKGYWYRDGYIRTSCYEFTLDSFSNSFVHLTNDAIQKNCEEYGKYETGNKISYQTFKRYLASKYPHKKHDFDGQVYQKIRSIAIDSVKAAYQLLTSNGNKNKPVFQIFGLDFMIDQSFNPWLIEVNTNPCLETSCPVLQKIIPKMLDDALKLSIDVIYPPPEQWPSSKRHFLGSTGNNGFELVFQEDEENEAVKANSEGGEDIIEGLLAHKRIRYQVQGIGEIQEDDEIYEEQQEE